MMKKLKNAIVLLLVCVMFASWLPVNAQAASNPPRETNSFVADYFIGETDQNNPFFDKVLPELQKNIAKYDKNSINRYYDNLPKAKNPENFQGLGSTTYANINGKTVTAEAFYRVYAESLHNPNCGMGLLLYQCIQYKRANPTANVEISFSSYHTSVSAAVCVIPESKYYGYMRSLFGTNYDEHGFVRISYMLAEAARMGIKVTMVNQLESSPKTQYNASTDKAQERKILSMKTYFEKALKTACYDKYAKGKKVSDFLNFVVVDWDVKAKTQDMQHLKHLAVSHYLDSKGKVHQNAVYFTSMNLDEINHRGYNGNSYSQSGVIISDHEALYRTTCNYNKLMAKYSGQEDLFMFRKIVMDRNNEQMAMYLAGKGDKIPKDEQILYLGGKNDPVFELYFTPLGGSSDTWDTVNNPIAKYVEKLTQSEDYIEFAWNEYDYEACHLEESVEAMLEQAFTQNKNVNNRISMQFSPRPVTLTLPGIQALKVGTNIGYQKIKVGEKIHAKDMLMSYVEDGVRHRVSLLTSCNFGLVAWNYRTNSMLVVNETDKTGGSLYTILGKKYSGGMMDDRLAPSVTNVTLQKGASQTVSVSYTGSKPTWTTSDSKIATVSSSGKITGVKTGTTTVTVTSGSKKVKIKVNVVDCKDCGKSDGITCSNQGQLTQKKVLSTVPKTFTTTIVVKASQLKADAAILSSDGGYDPSISFGLNKNGNPKVVLRGQKLNWDYSYVFDKVNVATGKPVNLSITYDASGKKLRCYVDGVLMQTISSVKNYSGYAQKHVMVVGGNHKNGNAVAFPGTIKRVAIWSKIRSGDQIASDLSNGWDLTDTSLLGAYDLTRCTKHAYDDLSKANNDLMYTPLWQDKEDVTLPKDYAYSIAVVGDTQFLSHKDPKAAEKIYDWILENKLNHKIEYVIGTGDITEKSADGEWETMGKYISKLNGKIPYILSRGNHDDWDDFNRYLHNDFYEKSLDGMMNSKSINLSDPTGQPGVVDGLTYAVKDVPEGGVVKGDLTNAYSYFNIQGTDYLIMTLDFAYSADALKWAESVIKAHPDHKVIIVTHAYMYRDGTTMDAGDCYPPSFYSIKGYKDPQDGDQAWEKCFSKYKNVLMVLSGHDPWHNIVYRQDKGVKGNTVTQMLIDPQGIDEINSAAMVAMLYFSNDGKTLTVRYYSVEKDCYGSPASQFTIDLY